MKAPNGDDDVIDLPFLQRLRQAFVTTARPAEATPQCLDDDTIAALAEGTLDAEARAAALPHLAGCAACRVAVASVSRALSDPSVAREIKPRTRLLRRGFYRIALPLAAAAALVLILARPRPDIDQTLHRAPTITAGVSPTPVAPVGRVATATSLRWSAVEGADRYRVTLFDVEGRALYETEVTGVVAALPDSVVLVPGRPYLWKVEARTGFDRWSASDFVEFSVGTGPPR
ncbi:MAG: hypothetical protein HY337_05360 [Gemmatimonadetes bacterium]|nr:hypothetical protein [Gemmatimonadota bacterium]